MAAVYGVGSYIRQVTECLKNQPNIRLNIVQFRSDKKEFETTESEGVRTYCFPYIQFPEKSTYSSFRYYRNCWRLLREYILSTQSSGLFFHLNFMDEHPLVELIRKHYPESSVLLTLHSQSWCFQLKGNISCLKRIIHADKVLISDPMEKKILEQYEEERKLFHAVDRVICLANFTKKLLMEEYGVSEKKIAFMYNGLVDEARKISEEDRLRLKKKLYMDEKTKIVLFVGRLHEIKGGEFLIRAFRRVLQQCPDTHLVIAGSGNFSIYLKEAKGIWHKITFTGRIEKEDLYTFYQIADIGVLPSFHEQCSYAAIEMMMFGLPVIGTTSTGLCEMIPQKENRVEIIEDSDKVSISETQLAQIICRNLANNKNADMYRRSYLEKYSYEKMCNALQKLYI